MKALAQQTVARETGLEGVGLHTGEVTRVRMRPAPAGHGVRFSRVDLEHGPQVEARLERVTSTDRGTTLEVGDARVHTVEHLLAAIGALAIDNVLIEVDGPEIPIMDGSFRPYFDLLQDAGIQAQEAPAEELTLSEAVSVAAPGGASYVAVPADAYRISATIEFEHPLVRRQFASFAVTPAEFGREVSAARTFGFMKEADALRARGLAKGVTLENALILDDEGLAAGELRYPDEFVRHKIGDVVGDLVLLGRRLRAHIVASRPSHAGNLELARKLASARRPGAAPRVDIQKIMQHLPHRYPMLLVDRIIEVEVGRRIVGIKNVTINEPFFQGHFPGHPVMPGVLIIEAMMQVGGLLLMDAAVANTEDKVVYVMSLDNVKFRRPVTPGDQVRFELEMLQLRRHVCKMRGVGYVDGQVVAEAEMMARIVDR